MHKIQKFSLTELGESDFVYLSVIWAFRNGIKQRRTSWQDGVLGTNCPIPPNTNWTYKFQLKDQVGTFNYFPSTQMHRAFGGYGALNIAERSVITTPYSIPDQEFTLLISDWFKNFTDHKVSELWLL